MTMITIFKRMTPTELDKAAAGAKKDIVKWFKANPKRKVCTAQLWYDRVYKINRSQIDKGITAARKDADK